MSAWLQIVHSPCPLPTPRACLTEVIFGLQIPYRVSADSGGNVKLLSSNAKKDFSPEEISALVLRKLVDDAANFLNDKVGCCSPSQLCWSVCLLPFQRARVALPCQ